MCEFDLYANQPWTSSKHKVYWDEHEHDRSCLIKKGVTQIVSSKSEYFNIN